MPCTGCSEGRHPCSFAARVARHGACNRRIAMSQFIAMFVEGLELVGVPLAGTLLFAVRPVLLLTVAAIGFAAGFGVALTIG